MNGVHDMGGMDGFGKVEPEPNEPVFHTDWEAPRAGHGARDGAAGALNIDMSRFYREIAAAAMSISAVPITEMVLGLETCWSTRALSPPRRSRPAMRCSRQSR